MIKENDLSTALFAPGWVYEKYESTFKASQDKYVVKYLSKEKIIVVGFTTASPV